MTQRKGRPMQLDPTTTLHGFTITSRQDLPEIEGEAILGRHGLSGAKLLYLKNDDHNKAFAIGFTTPPCDDTGVFHILEHSVLCGSRRFPVKEPFVDLLKSSMQTFLNAMTFPDKTLYPVASTNEQDLFNLMDVYLDAVFHPQIYVKPTIFEQEGWHHELLVEDADGTLGDLTADNTVLTYNGVVYNEMKGALSDPTAVLFNDVQQALFPDTCYGFESGGTPQSIPTLTYENFLDEHRRHYRPDNSYIILYGDVDIDRALAFLDERYLTPVAEELAQADARRIEEGLDLLRPRTLGRQAPLVAPHQVRPMDTSEENACAACGYVIGDATDPLAVMAADILLDAYFGSNEAPLKRALLDRGIAHNVQAILADSVAQPFVLVQLSLPALDAGATLDAALREEARALLDVGLDKSLIEAAIDHAEFQLREHEMGMADGVAYAMQSLAAWLYDEEGATTYLRYGELFETLRQALSTDYYERLLTKIFIDSNHKASREILPTPGQSHDDAAQQLRAQNQMLTESDRRAIVQTQERLRQAQEAPDSLEAMATLPRLQLSDLGPAPDEPPCELMETTAVPCLRHTMATHGIVLAYRYFAMEGLEFDEMPYAAVLALVLGKLDTARHSAAEIDTLVQAKLGNLNFFIDVYTGKTDASLAQAQFVASASALEENTEDLAQLVKEVLMETRFGDHNKILDLLKQQKIGLEQAFINDGHNCATLRLKSYCTAAGVLREAVGNVGYYRFLCELIEDFDRRASDLGEKLHDLSRRLFCDNRCIISFAGSEGAFDAFWQAAPQTGRTASDERRLEIPAPQPRNEAFIVPSDVCYAANGWDLRLFDERFDGAWLVAARALTYDYLWNEVRVKGGAYGVGFQARRQGDARFYSYRDPHLDQTLARFNQSAPWLASLALGQEALDGFVVAAVAALDAPIKCRALLRRQDGEFFCGRTRMERLAVREEVIQTSGEALRQKAAPLQEVLDRDLRCVFGNESIIRDSKLSWNVVELL